MSNRLIPWATFFNIAKDKRLRRTAIVLFGSFFTTYFILGIGIAKTEAFHVWDAIFNADIMRVISYLTSSNFCYEDTGRHPLFILFFNPLGSQIANLLKSSLIASLFLTAVFGASGVVLFFLLLKIIGLNTLNRILLSTLFGISSSHLFFSSIPETFAFSSASLIFLVFLTLCSQDHKTFLKTFVPATIFSFGITAINLSMAGIAFFHRFCNFTIFKRIILTLLFLLGTTLMVYGLALLQKAVYPSSKIFLSKDIHLVKGGGETYFRFDVLHNQMKTITHQLPYFFAYNVIAPEIKVMKVNEVKKCITLGTPFESHEQYWKPLSIVKFGAFLLYGVLVVTSLFLTIKFNLYKQSAFLLFLSYFLFTFCFHLFWENHADFLFSPHYTFSLMAMLAYPFKMVSKNKSLLPFLIILVLVFGVINNLNFIHQVIISASNF